MLPDLRIVIVAVAATFILTVGAGFVISSRLMQEQIAARDAQGMVAQGMGAQGMDEAPINRIALTWPEPSKFEPAFNLDAEINARTAKEAAAGAVRNPVRDITIETAAQEASQVLTIPATPPMTDIEAATPLDKLPTAIADEIADETVYEPAEGTPSLADTQDNTHTEDGAQAEDIAAAQDEPAAAVEPEPTGTIAAAPAADAPASPDDTPAPVLLAPILTEPPTAQTQDEAQKPATAAAMQDSTATEAEKPAAREPAKNNTATRKKRTRKAARRPAAPHVQPAQPASQGFDLFGLRAAAAARQAAQTQGRTAAPAQGARAAR
jgi:hypothetical protein